MAQGQRLNLKWTVADTDKILASARAGKSVFLICAELKGTSLQSEPEEILKLVHEAGGHFARARA